jgi:hypothetical protein
MKPLCDPMFMPIGGEGDGQMERKVERRWGPLLAAFKSENAKLASSVLQTHSGMRLKSDFNEKALQQKYQLFRQKYDEMKKRHKVGRHQLRGETGSAAEGQPTNVQEAIDRATADWPLFSMFDASFGSLQRLREDTHAESVSPAKPLAATAVQEPGAPATRPVVAPAAKRPRVTRTYSPVCTLPEPGRALQEDRESTSSPDSDRGTSQPPRLDNSAGCKSRSRASGRDLRLAKAVGDNRMDVAMKTAEVQASTMMEVAKIRMGSKKEIAEQQLALSRLQADAAMKQAESAEKQVEMAAKAIDVQEAHYMSLEKLQREKYMSREVLEMTRMFMQDGKKASEARQLAIKEVFGE